MTWLIRWYVHHRHQIHRLWAKKWYPDWLCRRLVGVSSRQKLGDRKHFFYWHFVYLGKDIFSPEVDSSPAPSSAEPQNTIQTGKQTSRTSSFEIENLLKTAEQVNRLELYFFFCGKSCTNYAKEHIFRSQSREYFNHESFFFSSNKKVTGFCRSPQETRKSSPTGSVTSSVSNVMLTPSRQLTDAEKLRKVISELVDTERAYVKVSFFLLKVDVHYLRPRPSFIWILHETQRNKRGRASLCVNAFACMVPCVCWKFSICHVCCELCNKHEEKCRRNRYLFT